MQPPAQDSVIFGHGLPSSCPPFAESATSAAPSDAAKTLYNLPSTSEKLTDGTLPLSWPLPYLENLKAGDETPAIGVGEAPPISAEAPPLVQLQDDYAQLMRKLHAETMVNGSANADKALGVAHYISTLIAALALMVMMGIVLLNLFPALT